MKSHRLLHWLGQPYVSLFHIIKSSQFKINITVSAAENATDFDFHNRFGIYLGFCMKLPQQLIASVLIFE